MLALERNLELAPQQQRILLRLTLGPAQPLDRGEIAFGQVDARELGEDQWLMRPVGEQAEQGGARLVQQSRLPEDLGLAEAVVLGGGERGHGNLAERVAGQRPLEERIRRLEADPDRYPRGGARRVRRRRHARRHRGEKRRGPELRKPHRRLPFSALRYASMNARYCAG